MPTPIEAVANLLTERRYSSRSIGAYKNWAQRLQSYFSGRSLRTISEAELASFFRQLQTQVGDQSVRQAATAVRFLYKEVLNKPSLAEVVPKIRLVRNKAFIPTQQDVFNILAKVDDETTALILKCIYGMGLELKEACSLRAENFDLNTNRLKFNPQRTRGIRSIPIPLFIRSKLTELLKSRKKGQYVFQARNGRSVGDVTVQRAWQRARNRVPVPGKVDIRSLRHAYILHLVQLGVPLKDVLHDMGMDKARPLEFYSQYAGPMLPMTFSPADRLLTTEGNPDSTIVSLYVSESRIVQIASLNSADFDFTRLVNILHELNVAARSNSYLSVAFLVRAIIDHIPPIFGFRTFVEVVNNYKATISLKRHMDHLQKSLRNVADAYLHETIRPKEELPHFSQVDFRAALDHLLAEVVRVLGKKRAT